MAKRLRRIIIIIAASAATLTLLLALSTWLLLRGSLPRLDGERTISGLTGTVNVNRDSLGVPVIKAKNRVDAARALGYVHAQDRFFQMDLQRRRAAGELAELLGPALVSIDRSTRIHRFRKLSRRIIPGLTPRYLEIIKAYSEGVNTGLEDLRVRPFEYLLLRKSPESWRPEDTILTLYAMFLDLSLFTYRTEFSYYLASDILPSALSEYLLTPAAKWDAPLQEGPPLPVPIPDSTEVDTREWLWDTDNDEAERPDFSQEMPGSNNWAVAGELTSHGGALLANDMHLSHGIPNIWYRAKMGWTEEEAQRTLAGVTLPGTPLIIAGSNGDLAWGFTNSYVDAADLVRLQLNPADSTLYRTPDGWEKFRTIKEIIEVAGSTPDTMTISQTRWGPVRLSALSGNPMALRWTAYDTAAVNMKLVELERAATVDQGVEAASRSGIPPQNFVCADRIGDIAWTIAGRIPRRFGWNGRLPVSWANERYGWAGYLSPREQPRIIRPPEGILWTANNRVAGEEFLNKLGDGGYGLGARAMQIRNTLREMDRPEEKDMLALQLDDRAIFMNQWREFALEQLHGETAPVRIEFARIIREDWSGRASVNSAGYRLIRAFTYSLIDNIYGGLTAPVRSKSGHDWFRGQHLPYRHAITWELIHRRPPHLLPPPYRNWDEPVLSAVDEAMEMATGGGAPASEWKWGKRNVVDISHPFVRLVPQLRRFLAAPADRLPGDSHMPRVQSVSFGASERMVVSPGREESGIFHMPGGQCGHPLSDYFLAGHRDWARGRRSSFLPGVIKHQLVLKPGGD
ncbi:MAG: penicillin acylase family protein [Candidatus Latescibacteria bacterium]|nr:penicillin acylase family protein [bacterium]MBD3424112.1 penicillin acylase family protein [Candidatus Latescibacterota bacterium]